MSDMMPSDQTPLPEVRFLKVLVTALTATMILGLIIIVALIVIRMPDKAVMPVLPETITLPEGVSPAAITFAGERIVVLSADDRVLVYGTDGRLIGQTVLAGGQ